MIQTDSDESIDFKAHEESKEIDKIEINELLVSMQGESRNVTNAGVSGLHSKAESSEIMKIIDHVSFTRPYKAVKLSKKKAGTVTAPRTPTMLDTMV